MSIFIFIVKIALKVRYRVKVKGLENLTNDALRKPGGIVFLPNHPSLLDPALIGSLLWKKFRPRSVATEYIYYTPWINTLMRIAGGLPIPAFDRSNNSLKIKHGEKTFQKVFKSLRDGDNLLFYPSGQLKQTGVEIIGGSSGCHRILHEVPEANVVLVRTTGFWGSMFSRALIGKTPSIGKVIVEGMKIALKNLIIFTPKRDITIEFCPAGNDFPFKGSRLEINRYLEDWYNRPFLSEYGERYGEPFKKVSYSRWCEKYPEVQHVETIDSEEIDLSKVSEKIKTEIIGEIAKMAEMKPEDINPEMNLASDIGLDSLDSATLLLLLEDNYSVSGIPPERFTTVAFVLAAAAGLIKCEDEEVGYEEKEFDGWKKDEEDRPAPRIVDESTIQEAFLRTCDYMGNAIACGDDMAGVFTYKQVKMRAILLAEYIRELPGKRVGVMLPASTGAYIVILATLLAGKVPVMVNWTVGTRHLEAVVKITGIEVVLTSWKFIDRLDNVDFNGIEEMVIMLEDVGHKFTLPKKIKALLKSRKDADAIIKDFALGDISGSSPAVILFTSGTESLPKGVPLSHKNILSNVRGSAKHLGFYPSDIFYAILPPFHSFGFMATGMLPLLSGIRVAYFPDPTDSARLARGIKRWKATVLCAAPTFLKGILKVAMPGELDSMRAFVCGAEKTPQDIYDQVSALGSDKRLIEGYGITECSPIIAGNVTSDSSNGVGTPLEDVEVCIVNHDTYAPLSQGERGLILVRGPNVFSGYLGGSTKTSPFIEVQGKIWYISGDLGYIDEHGNIIIAGRKKRFVKMGGEMISLVAIEGGVLEAGAQNNWDIVGELPGAAVCALEKDGEKPKFYVFTTFSADVIQVNTALRELGFGNLVKVSGVTQMKELPLSGTGKINYRSLEENLRKEEAERSSPC